MSYSDINPCIECSTNQQCCRQLSGLLLAEQEYKDNFENHEAKLDVSWSNKFAVVSVKPGESCPHWGTDGCGIYQDRPIDCRVFPYVTSQILENRHKIKITFHNRSDCPIKERLYLLTPEAEVRSLLTALGIKIYGAKRRIIVRHEDEIAAKLLNRIKAVVDRQWRKLRRQSLVEY